MKKLKKVIFLLMSVSLIGCAGHQQAVSQRLSESAEVLIGKSADDLLKAKGPPDATAQLTSGERLWTYRTTKSGERKGWSMSIGRHVPEYMTWRENTNFVIGPDGLVKSYTVSVE